MSSLVSDYLFLSTLYYNYIFKVTNTTSIIQLYLLHIDSRSFATFLSPRLHSTYESTVDINANLQASLLYNRLPITRYLFQRRKQLVNIWLNRYMPQETEQDGLVSYMLLFVLAADVTILPHVSCQADCHLSIPDTSIQSSVSTDTCNTSLQPTRKRRICKALLQSNCNVAFATLCVQCNNM